LCLARLSAVYRMTLRAIMLIHYWKPARDIHLQLQNFFQKTLFHPLLICSLPSSVTTQWFWLGQFF